MSAEIIAIIIFLFMFVMIVLDKVPREYVTLGCGLATIVLVFGVCMKSTEALWNTLNLRHIFTLEFWYSAGEVTEETSGINWATIIFIAGMMVMVEGLARVGFFRWLCMRIAALMNYKPMRILIAFMIMSFILAMFIDSITVILFLAAVTIELSQLLSFNPVPMILAEIFCANLGGSATMCGDPPNIIIGTSLHLTFFDFLMNTGIIAVISMAFVLVYFYLLYRKEYSVPGVDIDPATLPNPSTMITDKREFAMNVLIFLAAVILLITHASTGLSVAFIGTLTAILSFAAAGKNSIEILKKVDYRTLLFFIGLFIVVGGLEETGVLTVMANWIEHVSDGKTVAMVVIIIWVSAVASAFIDNIPFAATMVPIIKTLSVSTGMPLNVLAWSLAMGADVGGSATPIGASANVVGISVASKSGHVIGWKEYCSKVVVATIIVLAASTGIIIIRYL